MAFFGFFKRKRDPLKELKELLEGFELPSFPKAAMQVLDTLRDPKATATQIARTIEADPGIYINVLKTINSAAFGLPREVVSMEHAVALLGRARLESLILPLAVKDCLPQINVPCLDLKRFWLAACRRGSLARHVAKILHPTTHVEAFSAGLLQDLAVPVIMHVKQKMYCPTLETWNVNKDTRLDELERKQFGFDHQTIGALMAEQWNLPDYLIRAISKHHYLENGTDPAVYLVSHIRYNQDLYENSEIDLLIEIAQKKLGLSRETIFHVIDQSLRDAEELVAIFQ